MNLRLLTGLLSILLGLHSGAQPETAAPAPADSALFDELRALDTRSAAIEDLSADFTQEKHTALLKKPLVSEGSVRMRPPLTRWDTQRPRRSVLLLDDKELRLFDPEARTLEVFEVSGHLSRMTASPVPRLSAVREEFSIDRLSPADLDPSAPTESALALRLTPLTDALKDHVSEVRVLIDRALACATLVEVTDADGDRTVIRFRKIRINTGIAPESLRLEVPEGTTIVRPLEGLTPPQREPRR